MSLKKSGTKLYYLLSILDKKGLKRFDRFVNSSYFNTNPTLIRLFEFVRKYHPEFPENKVSKALVSEKMFGEDPDYAYNDKRMRDLFSDLILLVERFLVAEELERKKALKLQLLADRYDALHAHDLFLYTIKRSTRDLERSELLDLQYYEDYWNVGQRVTWYPTRLSIDFYSVEKLLKGLDQYYLRSRIPILCNLFFNNYQKELPFKPLFLEETLVFVKETVEKGEGGVALLLYHEILSWLNRADPEEDSYERMKAMFSEEWRNMAVFDVRMVGLLMINICILMSRKFGVKYHESLWQLYGICLDSKALMVNDRLSETAYTNIVVLACSLKKMDWVRGFVDEFTTYLDPKVRDSVGAYSEAYLKFVVGDLDAVGRLLNSVEFAVAEYGLRGRSLMLRMLFEEDVSKGYFGNQIMFYFDSFRKYLDRQTKVSKKTRKSYQNLIIVTRKLVRIINRKSKDWDEQIKQLFSSTENMEDLALKGWLLRQIHSCLPKD